MGKEVNGDLLLELPLDLGLGGATARRPPWRRPHWPSC
jgi:hypothetical protein